MSKLYQKCKIREQSAPLLFSQHRKQNQCNMRTCAPSHTHTVSLFLSVSFAFSVARVAVCCSVQCVAVCSVLQCVAVCCSVFSVALCLTLCLLQHSDAVSAVCCSVLQCVAVCCSVLQCLQRCVARYKERATERVLIVLLRGHCSVLQCVAVCCSVLQRVTVCCSVLQCAAMCCSLLYCDAMCQFFCRSSSRSHVRSLSVSVFFFPVALCLALLFARSPYRFFAIRRASEHERGKREEKERPKTRQRDRTCSLEKNRYGERANMFARFPYRFFSVLHV